MPDDPSTDPSSAKPSASQNQDRLRAHFANHEASAHPSRWDDLWKEGTFLPWDRGLANPALIDALREKCELLGAPTSTDGNGERKRALVPGCGKGYDVALLAAAGYDAYGIEISESAAGVCREWLREPGEGKEGEYKVWDEKVGKGKMKCVLGDFFEDAWVEEAGGLREGFDLIYDNTFLCALPPSLRAAWALRMSRLLAPTGVLICLEFPTHKPPTSGGPPWAVTSGVYVELFKRPGEEINYDDAGKLVPQDKEESDTALVRAGYWKPARTHQVGIVNGEVKDCVSVWKHKG
ncbi:S-adenosyl-L-methionine-dependent methyltransferase [Lindgomyces ingoldianus]|uniref:S-adenosyl-L-methionine-dependent methyltransferase n=1 Tax=Lindgomyces ingoldianus TaxID=673940 RepID=A0ACB6RA04_9PLEO|nr:S-adenosyl-L-methionine-dependent methyltransferase [Lindgomyces ingoldianus]KAF2475570.1 S-adenosyl-L-methionine-dependent methyltransferase [Lindgomyces ingoldianus]